MNKEHIIGINNMHGSIFLIHNGYRSSAKNGRFKRQIYCRRRLTLLGF
jgi:hypothetical protein